MAGTAEPAAPDLSALGPGLVSPPRSFAATTHDLLGLTEQAVTRIETGEGGDAALRELWVLLLDLTSLVQRDPGLRMAADDLYSAASVLVVARRTEPFVVDARRWRLLNEAALRLRARLALAQPSEKARGMGLS